MKHVDNFAGETRNGNYCDSNHHAASSDTGSAEVKVEPYYCPELAGRKLVTLGNVENKRTVSMVTAFRHLSHMTIAGCETFEQGSKMVLDGLADALMVPILYPSLKDLWVNLKLHAVLTDIIAPFVYGQFGDGQHPDMIALHPAAGRFLGKCPASHDTVLEYVDSNDKAPGRAARLHRELNRTVGFIAPDFVAQHEAPDQVRHTVENSDVLPFVVLTSRHSSGGSHK